MKHFREWVMTIVTILGLPPCIKYLTPNTFSEYDKLIITSTILLGLIIAPYPKFNIKSISIESVKKIIAKVFFILLIIFLGLVVEQKIHDNFFNDNSLSSLKDTSSIASIAKDTSLATKPDNARKIGNNQTVKQQPLQLQNNVSDSLRGSVLYNFDSTANKLDNTLYTSETTHSRTHNKSVYVPPPDYEPIFSPPIDTRNSNSNLQNNTSNNSSIVNESGNSVVITSPGYYSDPLTDYNQITDLTVVNGIINKDYDFSVNTQMTGIITGTCTVEEGIYLRLTGIINGDLILSRNATLDVIGTLHGTVYNYGGRINETSKIIGKIINE